jgi:hypothetical protein
MAAQAPYDEDNAFALHFESYIARVATIWLRVTVTKDAPIGELWVKSEIKGQYGKTLEFHLLSWLMASYDPIEISPRRPICCTVVTCLMPVVTK